jgi:hypothetical protein
MRGTQTSKAGSGAALGRKSPAAHHGPTNGCIPHPAPAAPAAATPGLRYAATVDAAEVRVVLDPPPTAELFREHVDLAVTSDQITFGGFSRLVCPASSHTGGFLTAAALETIRARFGNHAADPTPLLRLPVHERARERNIERYCSLARLGAFSPAYRGKFILFTRAPVHPTVGGFERYVVDCVEVSTHVAAALHCRSIYFAGFGGTDGAFADALIAKSLARIRAVQRALKRGGLLVYFKYWWPVCGDELGRLAQRLTHGPAPSPIAPITGASGRPRDPSRKLVLISR